ncbi:hypothetical protein INT43_001868 [Umbelopsis isabellina]|uniref:CN hydrolase domain-containing protein n=1 Tax=Mortierella isabellina TaxID=91625 RepID=A0A8H7UH61_MORIS|nr:hypothetical protein INT43_001868 [Umbelopsis isabellina]
MKVAVAQVGTPGTWKVEDAIEKLRSYVEQAHAQEVKQLVFPEAFIGGYPKYSTFGAHVGERKPEGRKEYARYHSGAIEVPSLHTQQLEGIASQFDMVLVVGVIEKDGGSLYCTVIYIDPDVGLVGKHRKLMPTGTERLIWGQGDGSTMPVIETKFNVRTAAAICWENYMPMLRCHYYSKGVQIYCAPTVDGRQEWGSTMIHIALEGRCFVLSANQFTRQSDYPDNHPTPSAGDADAIAIAGGSMIVSPLGEVLAGPLRNEEGLLVADIDLNDIIGAKFDMDVTGHYSRSDVFALQVNEKANQFSSSQGN